MLSMSFISCVLFGEESVTREILLNSFKVYISSEEKEVIDKALAHQFDCNDEDLIDFLSNF